MLNASIIAGSKGDHPEKELEQFWLELTEGSKFPDFPISIAPDPKGLGHVISIATHISQLKSILSFYSSAFQGNTSLNLDGGLDISASISFSGHGLEDLSYN